MVKKKLIKIVFRLQDILFVLLWHVCNYKSHNAAVEHGITTLTLCNINPTYDHWEFVKVCHEAGIKPVLGVDIRNNHHHCYLLIAKSNHGLQWFNEFLSHHLINNIAFPIDPNALEHVFVIYPNNAKNIIELKPIEQIGIKPYELQSLYNFTPTEYQLIHQPVVVKDKEHFYLHCLLRAIDQNILLSQLVPATCCKREDVFVTPSKILAQCSRYPTLVTNTYKLLDACSMEMEFKVDKTRQVFGGSKEYQSNKRLKIGTHPKLKSCQLSWWVA